MVILSDLLTILRLDLVVTLFAPAEAGGLSDVVSRGKEPWVYQWFGASATTAIALYWVMLGASLLLLLGALTPVSCLVLLLAWSQHAQIAPAADRGIDLLLRNMLFLLMFSGAGRCLSVDSFVRWRRMYDPADRCMAWPRYLIILQVVVMYFAAGIEKMGFAWTPLGGYSALFLILQDWAVARFIFDWLANQPYYFLTQVGTAGTLLWEWTAPVMVYALYVKATPGGAGRLRKWVENIHFREVWLVVGTLFHLSLFITMELGIFPFAMVATYVAFYHPKEWERLLPRWVTPQRLTAGV